MYLDRQSAIDKKARPFGSPNANQLFTLLCHLIPLLLLSQILLGNSTSSYGVAVKPLQQ